MVNHSGKRRVMGRANQQGLKQCAKCLRELKPHTLTERIGQEYYCVQCADLLWKEIAELEKKNPGAAWHTDVLHGAQEWKKIARGPYWKGYWHGETDAQKASVAMSKEMGLSLIHI